MPGKWRVGPRFKNRLSAFLFPFFFLTTIARSPTRYEPHGRLPGKKKKPTYGGFFFFFPSTVRIPPYEDSDRVRTGIRTPPSRSSKNAVLRDPLTSYHLPLFSFAVRFLHFLLSHLLVLRLLPPVVAGNQIQ